MDLQLEKLVRLQDVDRSIAQLLEAVAALPRRLQSVEDGLRARQQAVEQAEKAAIAEETRRRRMESDLKDQQQKLVKFRDQSSSVKTNEQFHALQHEMGFVETEIRRIEDEILGSMIRSETLDGSRAESRRSLASQKNHADREKELAHTATLQQQQQVNALQRERAALRAEVKEDLLAQYDRIAGSARKTALARATGQRCLACQMALRPQFWNQVRTGTLLNCESCGRMLYFDPKLEPAPEIVPPFGPA